MKILLLFSLFLLVNTEKNNYTSPFRIDFSFENYEHEIEEDNPIVFRNSEFELNPRFKSRNFADIIPMQVSCGSSDSNIRRALKELRKKVECIPRDSIVNLKAPLGFMVSPNTVLVKKCGGNCNGAKSCISKKTTDKVFYVRSVNFQTKQVICSSVIVPEDTSCHCGCRTKITDCLLTQKYDKNFCTCKCANMDEYQKCINKIHQNFKWDEKTCSCVCENSKVCTTGSHWIPSQCRCAKLYN